MEAVSRDENYIQQELDRNKEFFDDLNLNDEQRLAVVVDAREKQIIAGAGTGKTTTIVANVKYLVERKNVEPSKILCLSYSNKSTDDLNKKFTSSGIRTHKFGGLGNVRVINFHSLGKNFLERYDNSVKAYKVVTEDNTNSKLNTNEIIKRQLLKIFSKDIELLQDLKLHFYDEFNDITAFTTEDTRGIAIKRQYCKKEYRKDFDTLNPTHTNVKSFIDLKIADFLFLNGIKYYYHEEYPEIAYRGDILQADFFLPDYGIFIEDFCVNEKGRSIESNVSYRQAYEDQMKIKKDFCRRSDYELVTLNSSFDEDFLKTLSNQLAQKGVTFEPLSEYKVQSALKHSKIYELNEKIVKFIMAFKEHGYDLKKFDEFFSSARNDREILFLKLVKSAYVKYQNYLANEKCIDYPDMILKGKDFVRDTDFDYIFVDEYQDISQSRFNLVKAIKEDSNASLIVVGDDWQSIYGFNGSDVKFFSKFSEDFPDCEVINLNRTYRAANELIVPAGEFVHNDYLKDKSLYSQKKLEDPIHLISRNSTYVSEQKLVYDILRYISETEDNRKVMILSRYQENLNSLKGQLSSINTSSNLDLEIEYNTFHGAKGLESDNVIIIDVNSNKVKGIPSRVTDDELLRFVTFKSSKYQKWEERRLFYVALTRTKNRVYLSTLEGKSKSPYINELEEKTKLKKFRYRNNRDYNIFGKGTLEILKYFWHYRRFIKEFDFECPQCGKNLSMFEINNKYFIVCEDCGFYVAKYFKSIDSIKSLAICPDCEDVAYEDKSGKMRCCYVKCPSNKIGGIRPPKRIIKDFMNFNKNLEPVENHFVALKDSEVKPPKPDVSPEPPVTPEPPKPSEPPVSPEPPKPPVTPDPDPKSKGPITDTLSPINLKLDDDLREKAKEIVPDSEMNFISIKLDTLTHTGKKYSKDFRDMLEKNNLDSQAEEILDYMGDLIKLGLVDRKNVRPILRVVIEEIF